MLICLMIGKSPISYLAPMGDGRNVSRNRNPINRKQPKNAKPLPNKELAAFLKKYGTKARGFLSTADLARKAGLNTSVLSMALSGRRSLSSRAAFSIAKLLCPKDKDIETFAQELFEKANLDRSVNEFGIASAADRVLLGQKISVGFIVS